MGAGSSALKAQRQRSRQIDQDLRQGRRPYGSHLNVLLQGSPSLQRSFLSSLYPSWTLSLVTDSALFVCWAVHQIAERFFLPTELATMLLTYYASLHASQDCLREITIPQCLNLWGEDVTITSPQFFAMSRHTTRMLSSEWYSGVIVLIDGSSQCYFDPTNNSCTINPHETLEKAAMTNLLMQYDAPYSTECLTFCFALPSIPEPELQQHFQELVRKSTSQVSKTVEFFVPGGSVEPIWNHLCEFVKGCLLVD